MAKELLSPDFTVEYLQKRLVDLQEAPVKEQTERAHNKWYYNSPSRNLKQSAVY